LGLGPHSFNPGSPSWSVNTKKTKGPNGMSEIKYQNPLLPVSCNRRILQDRVPRNQIQIAPIKSGSLVFPGLGSPLRIASTKKTIKKVTRIKKLMIVNAQYSLRRDRPPKSKILFHPSKYHFIFTIHSCLLVKYPQWALYRKHRVIIQPGSYPLLSVCD
jgi:hypothetical protein